MAKFDEALASGELTREELVRLISERVLLLHALGQTEALAADLRWLAALKPGHILDMRSPPVLSAMWTTIRDQSLGAVSVSLEHSQSDGKLRATARLSGTEPEGLRTRIMFRPEGGEWEAVDGRELLYPFEEGSLDLYAEVIGLGGVVAANHGSRETPVTVKIEEEPTPTARTVLVPVTPTTGPERDGSEVRRKRALWIGGAAALVVGGVIAAVLIARSDDGEPRATQLMPMVTF